MVIRYTSETLQEKIPKRFPPPSDFVLNINQPKPNITIGDVAFEAGITVSTVSRLLNNRVDVTQETAAVMVRVIQERR
jgi:plasmid maintenance system antidote protein VapI